MGKHTNTIHVYACDTLVTIPWNIRAFEGIAVNFITSNEHYLSHCVCVGVWMYLPTFLLRYLLTFLFVVEIVFHYLSVNAEVNENEFFALGWNVGRYENDERFIIGSKLITNAPQRIG